MLSKRLFAAIAIATLLLPAIIDQTDAQEGKYERSVMLKVTNTKTGDVQMKVWDLTAYTFEMNVSIDVPSYKLKKVNQIFGTNSFSFTQQNKVFEGEWIHFKVELIGTPLVGRGLSVQFI